MGSFSLFGRTIPLKSDEIIPKTINSSYDNSSPFALLFLSTCKDFRRCQLWILLLCNHYKPILNGCLTSSMCQFNELYDVNEPHNVIYYGCKFTAI